MLPYFLTVSMRISLQTSCKPGCGDGGKLIAMQNTVALLADKKGFDIKKKEDKEDKKDDKADLKREARNQALR